MIVDINIKQLESITMELSKLIDECEEAELNIFYQLKDVCFNWKDGNSLLFDEKIKNEKINTQVFLDAIQNKKDLFEYIYNEYKTIGNKIYYNLEKNDVIIKNIGICIAKLNSAIYELDSVDKSFYYEELTLINNKKNEIISIRNNLKSISDSIVSLYNRVLLIEGRIKAKISRFENIKINSFIFDFQ